MVAPADQALDRMAGLAAKARASFFVASPLFLKSCSRPTYLSFVREHFPSLVADYAKRFATADFASKTYSAQMSAMVGSACRKYGLRQRWSDDALLTENTMGRRTPPRSVGLPAQERLFA